MDSISFEKVQLSSRKYVYDISINGISFKELFGRCYKIKQIEKPLYPGAFVGGFNVSMLTYSQLKDTQTLMSIKKQWEITFDELLHKDLGSSAVERKPIIVCSECGDVGCGMVTAEIESNNDEIIWKNFGYQTNAADVQDRDVLKMLGGFRFEKGDYEMKLLRLKETILEEI